MLDNLQDESLGLQASPNWKSAPAPMICATFPTSRQSVSFLRRESTRELVQTLVEPVASCGTAGLDKPLRMSQTVQLHFSVASVAVIASGKSCLLAKREPTSCRLSCSLCILNAVSTAAISNVKSLDGTDSRDDVLAFHVPYGETQVLALGCLIVEADDLVVLYTISFHVLRPCRCRPTWSSHGPSLDRGRFQDLVLVHVLHLGLQRTLLG